jgi:hypothetical protein
MRILLVFGVNPSLFPVLCFLLPASCFLLPTSYFLLPTSCFLLPYPHRHKQRGGPGSRIRRERGDVYAGESHGLKPFLHLLFGEAEPDVAHPFPVFDAFVGQQVNQENSTPCLERPQSFSQYTAWVRRMVQDQRQDRGIQFHRADGKRLEFSGAEFNALNSRHSGPGLFQHVVRCINSNDSADERSKEGGQVAATAAEVSDDPIRVQQA